MASRNSTLSILRRITLQDLGLSLRPVRSHGTAVQLIRQRPRQYHATTTSLAQWYGPKMPMPGPGDSPVPFRVPKMHENFKKPTVATQPSYEMTFTCKPCGTRSTHQVSKQGYHKGSVLITCPDCKNRHVISDHLKIFGDDHVTIEDLMRERGQLVKKGTLSEDGTMEFWEDGTANIRN